jgi:2-hydroxy-3-oxopropionate reductase
MQAKDLNIVLDTAREYGIPLPSAALDSQLFNAMIQNDMGELDNSAIIRIFEQLAHIELKMD